MTQIKYLSMRRASQTPLICTEPGQRLDNMGGGVVRASRLSGATVKYAGSAVQGRASCLLSPLQLLRTVVQSC
jgi:hypothetical protein